MRNEETGGNGKWCMEMGAHFIYNCLSQLESVSEGIVTALLEYIRLRYVYM